MPVELEKKATIIRTIMTKEGLVQHIFSQNCPDMVYVKSR